MQRDADLERDILLAIEGYDGVSSPGYADVHHLRPDKVSVDYHVRLLSEAGLIIATDVATDSEPFAMWPIRLTIVGHDDLDTIRDEMVWQKTKEGAEAIGSFGLETLGALAKGDVREKIRKHTGLVVDF